MQKTIEELKRDKEQLAIAANALVVEFESKYPDVKVDYLSVWRKTIDNDERASYINVRLVVFKGE